MAEGYQRSAGEAEFQDESGDQSESESDGGPNSGGADRLARGFDDEDEDIEQKRKDEAGGIEVAGAVWCRVGNEPLEMKRVEDADNNAGKESREEEEELDDEGKGFFHGWSLSQS